MATITFDAHKFVRKLQEAGFEQKQADSIMSNSLGIMNALINKTTILSGV